MNDLAGIHGPHHEIFVDVTFPICQMGSFPMSFVGFRGLFTFPKVMGGCGWLKR